MKVEKKSDDGTTFWETKYHGYTFSLLQNWDNEWEFLILSPEGARYIKYDVRRTIQESGINPVVETDENIETVLLMFLEDATRYVDDLRKPLILNAHAQNRQSYVDAVGSLTGATRQYIEGERGIIVYPKEDEEGAIIAKRSLQRGLMADNDSILLVEMGEEWRLTFDFIPGRVYNEKGF